MSRNGTDLRITNRSGAKCGYFLENKEGALVHLAESPNVPFSTAISSPASEKSTIDYRNTEGDKSITHVDWLQGAGQKSLDGEKTSSSRFWDSKCIDVSHSGEISLHKNVTHTALTGAGGPVFSLNGTMYMGVDGGGLKYSTNDGGTWSSATISGVTLTTTIDSFTTDGVRTFFCVSGIGGSGTPVKGIFVNTSADNTTFARLGSGGTTDKQFTHICHSNGTLFAATPTGVGIVNTWTGTAGIGTGVYTEYSPVFLNQNNTNAGLVAAGGDAFWVATMGGRSYVYRLSYNVDTRAMNTEQFLELQSGFVATCAVGYLSTVYIGGYFRSTYDGVGRGGVYVCDTNQSNMGPLFELGEYPEHTKSPQSPDNDNRVVAMCEAGRSLYVATPRSVYVWDIDDGGYSHVFDHDGIGVAQAVYLWNSSSLLAWNGSSTFPTGWTKNSHNANDWTHTDQGGGNYKALYTGSGTNWTVTPPTSGNADPVLSNTTGTTLQFTIPSDQTGDIDITIKDGTRQARYTIGATTLTLYQYDKTTEMTGVQVWVPAYYEALTWYPGHWGYLVVNGVDMGYQWIPGYYTGGNYVAAHYETQYTRQDTADSLWSDETPTDYSTSPQLERVGSPSLTATVPVEKEVLVSLKGTKAAMSIDNGVSWLLQTDMTKADTSTNQLYIGYDKGASVDTIVLNSTSGSTTSGSSTFRPSITRHDGLIYMPYKNEKVTPNVAGFVLTDDLYATEGYVTQSHSTFKTGSMEKDFRYISVAHDELPANTSIEAYWYIDGVRYTASAETNGVETRIPINQRGFGIQPTIVLKSSTGVSSPRVTGVNVIWNFVKDNVNVYTLECIPGAGNGRWNEDPETAIQFIFTVANERATFEDRFKGEYSGTIEKVEFSPATESLSENVGGSVRIQVREG